MNLNQIVQKISNLSPAEPMDLITIIEQNEGIIPDGWEDLYEQLSVKADNLGLAYAYKEAEIEALKNFRNAVSEKIKSKETALSNFKHWLGNIIEKFGTPEKSSSNKITRWFRGAVVGIKQTTTIEVYIETGNEDYLPDKYKKKKISLSNQEVKYLLNLLKNKKDSEAKLIANYLENAKTEVNETAIKRDYECGVKEIPGVLITESNSVIFYNTKKLLNNNQ